MKEHISLTISSIEKNRVKSEGKKGMKFNFKYASKLLRWNFENMIETKERKMKEMEMLVCFGDRYFEEAIYQKCLLSYQKAFNKLAQMFPSSLEREVPTSLNISTSLNVVSRLTIAIFFNFLYLHKFEEAASHLPVALFFNQDWLKRANLEYSPSLYSNHPSIPSNGFCDSTIKPPTQENRIKEVSSKFQKFLESSQNQVNSYKMLPLQLMLDILSKDLTQALSNFSKLEKLKHPLHSHFKHSPHFSSPSLSPHFSSPSLSPHFSSPSLSF